MSAEPFQPELSPAAGATPAGTGTPGIVPPQLRIAGDNGSSVPGAAAQRANRPDVFDGSRLLNRDLSWLEFNRRVLQLAEDERTPLLERVRFLGIFSNNLDEFVQKRIGLL